LYFTNPILHPCAMGAKNFISLVGLLSVLATATVSATSQDCMINLFAKYGGSLKYKDIKEIAAKFPTKKQFDAIAKNGVWGSNEMQKYVGCTKRTMGLLKTMVATARVQAQASGSKCAKLFNKFGKNEMTWGGVNDILKRVPTKKQFKKLANKKGEWGPREIQKYLGC